MEKKAFHTGFTDLYSGALHKAVALNAPQEIVQLLIDEGADINAKNDNTGGTILVDAVATGNLALVRLLVNNGAKIEEKKPAGTTYESLHKALTELQGVKSSSDKADIAKREKFIKIANVLFQAGAQDTYNYLQNFDTVGCFVHCRDTAKGIKELYSGVAKP